MVVIVFLFLHQGRLVVWLVLCFLSWFLSLLLLSGVLVLIDGSYWNYLTLSVAVLKVCQWIGLLYQCSDVRSAGFLLTISASPEKAVQ